MAGKEPLVYVIAGNEDSLLNIECDKLTGRLVDPGQRATSLLTVHGKELDVSEVLDELRTASLFAARKVVVVKGADDFVSKNRSVLERYFDNPSGTGVLILTVRSWPANTRLAKKLTRVGKLITASAPKGWQLPRRLIEYAKEAHAKKLEPAAAELVVELAGDELGRLYGEIDKLAVFAHSQKTITAGHVESLIGHNRLYNTFSVIDACLNGQTAKAIERLREMFAKDRSAEYMVVGAFGYQFRRMFNAKRLLAQGLGPSQVAKQLRIWGGADRLFAQLRKLSLADIGQNLKQLAETDYAIKTGRIKPQVAAEQIVLKLAAGA